MATTQNDEGKPPQQATRGKRRPRVRKPVGSRKPSDEQDPPSSPSAPEEPQNAANGRPAATNSQGRGGRSGRPQRKKTKRRAEIDGLRGFQTFNIDSEIFQILLPPSDPDFPFDIAVLDIDLHVPSHYPTQGAAYIHVNNKEIPRGNAINIENGFNAFSGTLEEKLRQLDSNLERLVAMPPARTFTIIKGARKTADSEAPVPKPVVNGAVNKASDELPVHDAEPHKESKPLSSAAANDLGEAAPEIDKLHLSGSGGSGGSGGDSNGSSDSSSDGDSDSDSYGGSDGGSDDDYRPEYAHSSDDEDIDTGAAKQDMNKPRREGTELVFSNITLTNIALCEIVSLNVLMQCGRCKTMHTFSNLQSAEYGKDTKPRAELCEKCDLPLMMAFRKEYLHSMSHTAGYLDIEGGRAADLLPSSYLAMCGQCQQWSPVFKNVDLGAHRMMACRNCHTKMWITLELFDFVMLSSSTISSSAKQQERSKLPPSAPKQQLKLMGGQPLEKMGTCEHYRKSTRWFRFTCCQRVFPCDKCHDLEMNHTSEQASRMVCGYCSREQRFTAKCVYCEHDYTHRVTRFWEGGAGVRDRKLMSRKDKHKYKRDSSEKQKSKTHFKGKSKHVSHSG